MPINRGIGKKDVVHNTQLNIRNKKEWNSALCKTVDEPDSCQNEWMKSEKEKQILYNTMYEI